MRGVPVEQWDLNLLDQVLDWLKENFGEPNKKTYFIDYDYDLWTLTMRPDIYTMFALKWL